MLHKLKLTNFRQHIGTTLEFVPGVNTIVGLNNSGKSTIPEAIEFAMYGSRALRDTAKGFITDGCSKGSAVVELSLDQHKYVVGRDNKNAEIRKDGELEARYKDNVSTYMAHVTGVNQTGFRLGHYVRQKELAVFSSLRAGKRHETVERMLKVNAVDKAIKRIKDEVSELDITQRTLLGSYQDVEAIENELDDLGVAKTSLTQRVISLKTDLLNIHSTLKEQRVVQRDLLKKPELARLNKEFNNCLLAEADLCTLEIRLDELGEVSLVAYNELRSKVNELRETERQSITMASKKEELDKPEPVKPKEVIKPEEISRQALNECEGELAAAMAKLDGFLELDNKADCPTCHQTLSGKIYIEILKGLEVDGAFLATKKGRVENIYIEASKEYNIAKLDYDTYVADLRQYNLEFIKRQDLLKNYIAISFDKEEQTHLDLELIAMQDAREKWAKLDEQRSNLEKIITTKEELETSIAALSYLNDVNDDPELDKIITKNEEIEVGLNNTLASTTAEEARTDGRIIELNRLVSQMKTTRDSINSNYTKIANLKAMRDNFVLFKRHLTAKIRPLLEQVAETLFHKTTKERYASYDLSSDYEITLTTHKGFIRKLSTISGSENDLACLCLRLAIATLRSTKLAGSLGFIILDEISGSFDDERTKQTLEGLLELRDVIPQIINITHKEVEMKYADKLFTVKEVNDISTVTCG